MARKHERSETDGIPVTVKDLREMASAAGLSKQGTKAELQKRLDDHFAKPAEGECDWPVKEGSRQIKGEHGSTRRYAQALRAGVKPCALCRRANTQADLKWRREHRKT